MKIIGSDTQLEPGTTIATIGMFDGVHLGHATLLDFLKEQARQRLLLYGGEGGIRTLETL